MDKLIQSANIIIRANRPPDSSEQCITVFQQENFLQLTIQTKGCRFSACGSCSMCNYGCGQEPDTDKLLKELSGILEQAKNENVQTILLGASGSFLDLQEIPEQTQDIILKEVFQSGIPQIIIETHYSSVSDAALRRVSSLLPKRRIELEVGLESANQWIREHILNKHIDSAGFEAMISRAHHFQMTVTANLLLGVPFLSEAAQISETLESIRWLLSKKIDYIMVFPLNIHPYTLFQWLHQKGMVQPTSLWMAVFLLSKLDDYELNHISMAWYGNRSIDYGAAQSSVPPQACGVCRDMLLTFFEEFYANRDLLHRKAQIEKILRAPFSCGCREKVFEAASSKSHFLEAEYLTARDMMKGLIGIHERT